MEGNPTGTHGSRYSHSSPSTPSLRDDIPAGRHSATMHASTARRLRKQALRAIPAQPFPERREDYQLPGAIKVQLLRNCGNSFHERADAHERRLYLPRLEMRGREAQESFPSADDEPSHDAHVQ